MSDQQNQETTSSPFETIRHTTDEGAEYWSARELPVRPMGNFHFERASGWQADLRRLFALINHSSPLGKYLLGTALALEKLIGRLRRQP